MKLILKSILYGLLPVLFAGLCVLIIFIFMYIAVHNILEAFIIFGVLIIWAIGSEMAYSDFKRKK